MKHLITILFCFICFNNSELEGCYCSDDNFASITFGKPDKISLSEFTATGFPVIGYGHYKFKDNKVFIEYLNNHYLDSIVQLKSDSRSDSLKIILRDYRTKELLPLAKVNYLHDKKTYWAENGKVFIPRLNDEIQIDFFYNHIISLKNTNETISGYEVFYDTQEIINKSKDTLDVKLINDSMLIFKSGIIFKKNYCKKKMHI